MKTSRQRISSYSLVLAGLITGLIALSACQPIRDPAVIAAQQTAIASGTAVPESNGTPEAVAIDPVSGVDPAMATVDTATLRVRALPSEEAEVVGEAKEGDSFPVTGISSDGEWIQVAIEDAPDGHGWLSAELVILAGDITSIRVVEVDTDEAIAETTEDETAETIGEETAEATDEATEESTAEATEEATATEDEEATEEATAEETPEVTDEATVEATEEATAEATEEATAEATAETTDEETAEATGEATVEATDVVTAEVTPEATETPTSGLGSLVTTTRTVTIVAELPLRVRSEPTTEVDNKIGNVLDGEVYEVLEVSDDGLWVRIAVPELGDGTGWISTEFVVFNEE